MKTVMTVAAAGLVVCLGLQFVDNAAHAQPAAVACPSDSVVSGTVCIDKFEASVWWVPPQQKGLIVRIQQGTVKLADLSAAGAVQLGLANGDLAALGGCPITGNGCVNVYAVSVPGVTPSAWVSYFQAAAAARNSLKRLPTSQEWLGAALGTPDGGPCNVGPDDSYPSNPLAVAAVTGGAAGCISDVGAFDMVGNLWEWVADWTDAASGCFTQPATFGGDLSCLGGSSGNTTMIRGGFFGPLGLGGGTHAGVFAVRANFGQGFSVGGIGFRGTR
jgi:Sulfatase-modifying factor enzyme 1